MLCNFPGVFATGGAGDDHLINILGPNIMTHIGVGELGYDWFRLGAERRYSITWTNADILPQKQAAFIFESLFQIHHGKRRDA